MSRDWQREIGRQFRVGYYRRQDSLQCIWLVNEKSEYEQTTDRDDLLRYFAIETLTDERDYYGVQKKAWAAKNEAGAITSDLKRIERSRNLSVMPVADVITTSASFVPSLLVEHRKVYSVRCDADVVMTSPTPANVN